MAGYKAMNDGVWRGKNMTDQTIEASIETNQDDDWTALKSWFQDNVLDDTPLSPEYLAQIADEAKTAQTGKLQESAVIYKWCPKKQRLVQK